MMTNHRAVTLAIAVVYMAICTALPCSYLLLLHAGYSESRAATAYAAMSASTQILPLLFGYLADRFVGVRRMTCAGCLLILAGFFIMAAQQVPAGICLVTVGFAAFKPCAQALLIKNTGSARAWRLIFVVYNIGVVIGPLLVGYTDNRFVFFGCAVIVAAVFCYSLLNLKEVSCATDNLYFNLGSLFPAVSLIVYIIAYTPASSTYLSLVDNIHFGSIRINGSVWIAINALLSAIFAAVIPHNRIPAQKSLSAGLLLTIMASACMLPGLIGKGMMVYSAVLYYIFISLAESLVIPAAQSMIAKDNADSTTSAVAGTCLGIGSLLAIPLVSLAGKTANQHLFLLINCLPCAAVLAIAKRHYQRYAY